MKPSRCLLVVLGSSLLAALPAPPQRQDAAVEKILAAALGPSPIEENLRQLTDEIGGRMSGTPAMRRAVEWAVAAFRQAGVDTVHTEPFPLPSSWSEGATRLEVIAPSAFPVHAVSLGWSPPTPPGGLEADLVDVGMGTEAEFAGARPAPGSILLVHSQVIRTWADLFNEYSRAPAILDQAIASGAAAVLWMSSREHQLLYRHVNNFLGRIDRLPQVLVAREDAQRIARLLAAGRRVRVRLDLPNRIGGPVEERNVVAEIRGRERPEEIVLLGAHLDSWDLGTGALDNGCNAALVMDAARAIVAAGVRPRRTLRFVLWSGEEQGMIGSWRYVQQHRAELDRIVAYVNFDEGIGRVVGYSLGGRADIEPALREILEPIESWGAHAHTADAFLGTDNFDFLLEGIPTLVATQEEHNYITNYHASSDTLDKVDLHALKRHTAFAAVTVYGIAEREARIGPRLTRSEVEALLRRTGLDQQMKRFGFWPLWERGERGRQP
jgi:carboxypeptidase Q